ncbi:cell adhesion molecule Dscam2-like isoform X3 [Frankliniella occidentalis]|nr:cell adhesion molecule Dscam2-like isoform X3 [Frankliniella occidentalis]
MAGRLVAAVAAVTLVCVVGGRGLGAGPPPGPAGPPPGSPHQGSHGPQFTLEPPASLEFSNSSGVTASCAARGSPDPEVRWIEASGKDVISLPRIREVLSNGSLHFPAFPGELYSSEAHAAAYRCAASNAAGTILSREMRVRADVEQEFQLQVHNVFALRGNVAVLRCSVPPALRSQLRVSGWYREDGPFGRVQIHSDNRHTITSTGTLHIRDMSASDSNVRFYCQTTQRVTGERRLSLPGQVVVTDPEGNSAPRIEHAFVLSSVRARAGNPTDLVCAAQGFPPPEYRWYRELAGGSRELTPGPGEPRVLESVLQWMRVSTLDAGRYVCVVSNPLGEDRREVALVVAAPLEARLRPQHQVVDAGSVAQFNCSVSGGAGMVHVTWLKDGRPLQPLQVHDRIRTTQLGQVHGLEVRHLERGDRGMYQCVARSADESTQASAELELGAVAPRLLSTFIEQTLQPGPPLSLRCAASGSPPPRITWLLDGAEVRPGVALGGGLGGADLYQQAQHQDQRGDVVGSLNMSSVRVQHGGIYTCVARNMMGSAQHTAALNVYGPPVSREPLNLTVVSGSDVWLRCPVGGFPLSRVSWQKGSTLLTPSASSASSSSSSSSSVSSSSSSATSSVLAHVSVFPNGSLVLRGVEAARDAGPYSCTASNQQGRSAEGRLLLHVMRPPEIAPFQFPSTLVEGNRAQVSCSLISGDLPISISWRKDGGPLPRDQAVNSQQMEFFSHLTFSDLRARHTGRYTCIASNAAATANYSADLVVRVAPTWMVEPSDESAVFLQPAALHCQVRGYPPPVTMWLRESGDPPGEPLLVESTSDSQLAPNGSLVFPQVQPHLQGHYTCRASNDIGQPLSKTVFLRVNVPAHFPLRQQNATAVSGGSVTLRCEALGDLPLHVSWSRPGLSSSGLTGRTSERRTPSGVPGVASELRLTALTREQQGAYHCHASNDFGQDEAVVHFAVKEPPGPPGRPHILEVGSRWLSVAWTPPAGTEGSAEPLAHYLLQFLASPVLPQPGQEGNSVDRALEAVLEAGWQNVTVPGTALSARLVRLAPATQHRIRVLAVNDLGPGPASQEAAALTLQEAPSGPPMELRVEAGAPESISVRWRPPPPSVGAVLGYQVGFRAADDDAERGPDDGWEWRVVRAAARGAGAVLSLDALETTLSPLRHFTRYEVVVRAFNQVGHGPATPPMYATTQEGVPSESPQTVRCEALSPQALRVRWEAPAPARQHGLLQGYKVFYQLQAGPGAPQGSEEVEVKRTTNLETNLHGLAKFANYSVRVAAFTGAGEGVRSTALYCLTEEDIPGPVEHIKALVMTSDSVLVAWSRPLQPNGAVSKYTVYRAQQPARLDFHKETVPGDREPLFEARRLNENQTYEFWVTASTAVGEGPPSVKVKQRPVSRVPARIASFPRIVLASAGSPVVLPCHAVGSPAPARDWRGPDEARVSAGRHRHLADGALELGGVTPDDAGNYSCRVENVFGADRVDYTVVVVLPPSAPHLALSGAGHGALHLAWKAPDNGGSPVTGYVMSFRRERGEWQEVSTDADRRALTLSGLKCGSAYQVRLSATNAVGRGPPSHTVSCKTQGGPPQPARQDAVLAVNATAVTLFPDAWPAAGCPLTYLVVELKSAPAEPGAAPWTVGAWSDWRLVTNAARAQEDLTLPDLSPASWYALRVTAHNDAGSHTQEFVVATSGEDGALPPPRSAPELLSPGDQPPLLTRMHVLVPTVAAAVCVSAVGVCVCTLARRRKDSTAGVAGGFIGTKTRVEVENRRNLDHHHHQQQRHHHLQPHPQLYSPATARKGDSSLSGQKGSDTSAADYDICPYATFSLANTQPSGPVPVPGLGSRTPAPAPDYSLHFQTFTQRDCYEAGPRRSLSRPAIAAPESFYASGGIKRGKRLVDSPPDGLNLEISCISSQQTLPMTATNHRNQQQQQQQQGGKHERASRSGSRPRSLALTNRSDSDSSGVGCGGSPRRASPHKLPLRMSTPGQRAAERRAFEQDSSTESAEASPEPSRRSRRGNGAAGNGGHRRGMPAR